MFRSEPVTAGLSLTLDQPAGNAMGPAYPDAARQAHTRKPDHRAMRDINDLSKRWIPACRVGVADCAS